TRIRLSPKPRPGSKRKLKRARAPGGQLERSEQWVVGSGQYPSAIHSPLLTTHCPLFYEQPAQNAAGDDSPFRRQRGGARAGGVRRVARRRRSAGRIQLYSVPALSEASGYRGARPGLEEADGAVERTIPVQDQFTARRRLRDLHRIPH